MGNYIGPDISAQKDTQNRVTYVASDGQTTFSANYTPGYIDVYQNGIKLQNTDFTALNGTTFTLGTACVAGDVLEYVAIKASSPYDFYTRSQADQKMDNFYGVALNTGDAMTVTLTPTPSSLVNGMELKIRVPSPNTVTNPALTIMGLGVSKTIYSAGGQALIAGTYVANQEITLRYNQADDRFELTAGSLIYGATAGNSDNSTKLATTSWIRNAMSNIATSAGFASSLGVSGSNGYIKFPSWLGGFIIQWGFYQNTSNPLPANSYYQAPNQTLSITYPNAHIACSSVSSLNYVISQAYPIDNSTVGIRYSSNSSGSLNVNSWWLSWGW